MERSADAEQVKAEIRRAFAGVSLGGGTGLFEAQGIDGYESEEACARLRAGDEKSDWTALRAEDLNGCYTSPCFFDAEGMRFHLPAYMCADLEGRLQHDLPFHLIQSPLLDAQMALLDGPQRAAVRSYLQWAAAQPTYAFSRDHIRRALDGYWAR